MNLVIVESPAKAKTINKYLGSDYEVLASYGHVRDLPSKDGSVLPDDDFSMHWEADAKGAKRLSEIAEAAKRADRVIQQHGLHFARGVQAVVVEDFFVGDAQFGEQQPNNRRSVRGFGGESSFGHGLYPFLKQLLEYNQLGWNEL